MVGAQRARALLTAICPCSCPAPGWVTIRSRGSGLQAGGEGIRSVVALWAPAARPGPRCRSEVPAALALESGGVRGCLALKCSLRPEHTWTGPWARQGYQGSEGGCQVRETHNQGVRVGIGTLQSPCSSVAQQAGCVVLCRRRESQRHGHLLRGSCVKALCWVPRLACPPHPQRACWRLSYA